MQHVSVVPGLRVRSIEETLPLWTALGFELAFAFAGDERVSFGSLERATLARLDAPSENPISVFLDTEQGSPGTTVHLMLSHPGEVDEAAHRLQRIGARLTHLPADRPWGMRDLRVTDADGNVLIVGAAIEP